MYLQAIILEGCWYSTQLINVLNNNNINIDYIKVTQNNKDEYKTTNISTFPQVYLVNNKLRILIGGYIDVNEIINIINIKNYNNIKKKISSKYKLLSNKIQLKIIKAFIKIQ